MTRVFLRGRRRVSRARGRVRRRRAGRKAPWPVRGRRGCDRSRLVRLEKTTPVGARKTRSDLTVRAFPSTPPHDVRAGGLRRVPLRGGRRGERGRRGDQGGLARERDVEYKGDVDLVTATDKKCEVDLRAAQGGVPRARVRGRGSVAAADGACRPSRTTRRGSWTRWTARPTSCTATVLLRQHRPDRRGARARGRSEPHHRRDLRGGAGLGRDAQRQPIAVAQSRTCLGASGDGNGVGRDAATVDAIMARVRSCVETCRSLRPGSARGTCAARRRAPGRLLRDRVRGAGRVGAAVICREAGGLVMDPSGGAFAITRGACCAGIPTSPRNRGGAGEDTRRPGGTESAVRGSNVQYAFGFRSECRTYAPDVMYSHRTQHSGVFDARIVSEVRSGVSL